MAAYLIELTRSNVTPGQFLSYVKTQCKVKGYDYCLSLDDFRDGDDSGGISYRVIDGIKHVHTYSSMLGRIDQQCDGSDSPFEAETSINRPFEKQSYCLRWDGRVFNEIIEFSFDDEKRGHGYFYLSTTI